jgi:hypothetical protein
VEVEIIADFKGAGAAIAFERLLPVIQLGAIFVFLFIFIKQFER